MTVLALDTAATVCSIALVSDKGNWYTEIDAGLRHSELLLEAADALMKLKFAPRLQEVAAVACMKGPGSFTGLRIGFSAAKGLCLALAVPLLSFSTLDCAALPFRHWPGAVMPIIDAKKRRYFTALYQGGARRTEYLDKSAEDLALLAAEELRGGTERILLTGPDAAALYAALTGLLEPRLAAALHVDPNGKSGGAKALAALAKQSLSERGIQAIENEVFSGPLYLRKSDAVPPSPQPPAVL
ncbi:MAG: tRNA (adenosine(37)-N6)-threonylcarbamoyltransferase complex dimerization subunit type 1 TsaB [Spirochaetaceae bacterium]|jgi:tRNA threonylcarbamoyladenosine biosynthesis protein TsaB|nr:tRNA (adenosine(37)-N6)-threonylcarbamoyltransferase complex dimerization subunit type 1 TsaB [Spirochaetaceae bacterium]